MADNGQSTDTESDVRITRSWQRFTIVESLIISFTIVALVVLFRAPTLAEGWAMTKEMWAVVGLAVSYFLGAKSTEKKG